MTEPGNAELVGNMAVEDAAIAFVIDYEWRHGRARTHIAVLPLTCRVTAG